QNEFYIRNLYKNILTPQHENYSFQARPLTPDDFHLSKITISVSNTLDDEDQDQDDVQATSSNSSRTKQTRRRLDSSVKEFLESVFINHPSPNRKERELIAKKCGVSPLQIRVWFTNKRMRRKQTNYNNNNSNDNDEII
ncbi:uncharacterized protein SPAPADRAFT_139272, partial [Spathaspora passalidarum NRRL Y-27907]